MKTAAEQGSVTKPIALPRARSFARHRFWLALVLAAASDTIQLALFPLFGEGVASPWNDALDVVVAVCMALLLGWHWELLPSLAAEFVPGLVLVPTWTAAVLVIGWRKRRSMSPKNAPDAFNPGTPVDDKRT
jgi:hypothetical protein